jgi:hypothetical protein
MILMFCLLYKTSKSGEQSRWRAHPRSRTFIHRCSARGHNFRYAYSRRSQIYSSWQKICQGKYIDLEEFELDVHQRNSIGLTQPITSIYSKSDGVVINNQYAINSITLHLWVTLGIYWYLLVIIITFFNVKDLKY